MLLILRRNSMHQYQILPHHFYGLEHKHPYKEDLEKTTATTNHIIKSHTQAVRLSCMLMYKFINEVNRK